MIKMSRTINLPESIPVDVKKAIMDLNATTHDELMSANTTSQKETITSDYTIPDSGLDSTYFVDLAGASADVNVTLPLMANNTGRKITIMVISEHASGYKCIVSPHATDANKLTTDGMATMWLPKKSNAILLQENETTGYWLSLHERITAQLRLETLAGFGSSDTKIPRFTTVLENIGNMFTENHSSGYSSNAKGLEITVKRSGLYSAVMSFRHGGGGTCAGFSVDSAQLATVVESITSSTRIIMASTAVANHCGVVGFPPMRIGKDKIIRPHTDGSGTNIYWGLVLSYDGQG